MQPVSKNPYLRVDLIERVLVIVFRTPRFPMKSTTRARRKVTVRKDPSYDALSEFLTKHEKDLARARLVLSADWFGTGEHFDQRQALIESLISLRSSELESLRVLPQPDTHGHWVRAVPWTMPNPVPAWNELDQLDQKIIEHIAPVGRSRAKDLNEKLSERYDTIRHAVARLCDARLLRKVGKDGYVIGMIPRGMPQKLVDAYMSQQREIPTPQLGTDSPESHSAHTAAEVQIGESHVAHTAHAQHAADAQPAHTDSEDTASS